MKKKDWNRAFDVGPMITLDGGPGILISTKMPTQEEPAENIPAGTICLSVVSGKPAQLFQKMSTNQLDWRRMADEKVGEIILTAKKLGAPEYLPCDGSRFSPDVYQALFEVIGDSPSLVRSAGPAVEPGSSARCIAKTADETQLVVGLRGSERLLVYPINADGSLGVPVQPSGELPNDSVWSVAIDQTDSRLVAVSQRQVFVYDWDGSSYNYNQQISDLFRADVVGITPQVAISVDGTLIAFATHRSPYLVLFKKAGSSYTRLQTPAQIPAGRAHSVGFRDDALQVTVGHERGDYFTTYNIVNDTLVKVTAVQGGTPNDRVLCVKYRSEDGTLILGHRSAPYVSFYGVFPNSLVKVEKGFDAPDRHVWCAALVGGNQALVVGHEGSPYISSYKVNGDIYKLSEPDIIPNSTVYGVVSLENSKTIYVAENRRPYLSRYKVVSNLVTPKINSISSNEVVSRYYIRTGVIV